MVYIGVNSISSGVNAKGCLAHLVQSTKIMLMTTRFERVAKQDVCKNFCKGFNSRILVQQADGKLVTRGTVKDSCQLVTIGTVKENKYVVVERPTSGPTRHNFQSLEVPGSIQT